MKRNHVLLRMVLALIAASSCVERLGHADERLEGIACRSVHLGYPAEEGLAFYNEVTVEDSAVGTYFMVCGWDKGYFGIQELGNGKKLLIFSVWDSGQNDPQAIDPEQRTQLVYQDDQVRVKRFGGEGTGGQSFFPYDWQIGQTYRFMVTAKVVGQRTEYGGYFFVPEDQAWKHLVTFSTRTGGRSLRGYYSFVEDFKRDRVSTTKVRRAYFGNGWVKTSAAQWVPLFRARFTADRNPVTNIDAGVDGDRFFLATGGETINAHAKLLQFIDRPTDKESLAPSDLPSELANSMPPRPPALDAIASLKQAQVEPGYCLQLMAAEPMVADPVAIDWGPDGRLWVTEMADYPYGMDGAGKPGGRIRYLEDVDGDGLYDRSVVFLEGIPFPTAVMPWRGGVFVTAAPELFFAEDTDGDGRADRREVLFRGFVEGNQQLRVNGLRYGIDNWVYCAAGGHHAGFGADNVIVIERTGERVPLGSRDFRFRPDTHQLDPQSGPSQFGRVRDDWGHWFGVQNSYPLWHYVLEDDDLRRNPQGRYGDVRQQLRLPANPAVFPASTQQKRYHSFEHSGHYTSACGPCIYRDDKLFSSHDVTHAFTCEPFHNVVQHHELLDEGVGFRGQRAATTSPYDFFASADRWSRPVMARTGPDGALWIVDMYRFMIEHPDWLPPEGREELKPFYRSGEGLGRIYRVYRSSTPPPRVPRLDSLTNDQLVDQLASSNGPLRDRAQMLLIEREAVEQRTRLELLLATHADPRARLHALATLDGLGCTPDATLMQALGDGHPEVRRHALRLAQLRAADAPDLQQAILQHVTDPSAKVRLQLLLTLGSIPGDAAAQALGQMSHEAADDPFMTAAFISSMPLHVQTLVDRLSERSMLPAKILAALLELTNDRPDLTAHLLRAVLAKDITRADADTYRRCSAWLASLNDRGRDIFSLTSTQDHELQLALDRLRALMRHAWQVAFDPSQDELTRVVALQLVRYDRPDERQKHRRLLAELLTPQSPSTVQIEAVRILVRDRDEQAIDAMLESWPSFLPAARAEVVDQLLGSHAKSVELLLSRIEAGHIGLQDLDAVSRDRLLHHANPAIAARAQTLFAAAVDPNRAAVLARYQSGIQGTGDPQRGALLFGKHCATCHAPEQGPAIGPDLKSLTDRSPAALLVSILDPSRAVEPKYLGYHAELKSGEVLFGLLLSESGNALRLQPLLGPTRELPRDALEYLESSRRSFMPEGFEAELAPQDLAHVIAYVQQLK